MTAETDLPAKSGVVELAASIEQLKENFQTFERVKKEILTKNDYFIVKDKNGREIEAIRKSGWYKFQVAFNLSHEIMEEKELSRQDESDYLGYSFKVRVIAPNGRYAEEVGTCDNREPLRKNATRHEIRAMAKTRATERGIIAVVGAKEVAAEDYENHISNDSNNNYSHGTLDKACTCEKPRTTQSTNKCLECGGIRKQ